MESSDKVVYKVLEALESNRGEQVSGARLAARVGVSRNAVWKAVNTLIEAGYPVRSSRKGYMLPDAADMVSEQGIRKYLADTLRGAIRIERYDEVTSTNAVAKELAAGGADVWTVVVSETQSAGRGRQGKSFYSGKGDGIYFSFVLRPSGDEVRFLTVLAAVAAARAIDKVFASAPAIKWVNDVYVNGKKCVGILTEAVADLESLGVEYAVVGIGINVREPEGGYPDEIKNIAGAAGEPVGDARNRIVAEVLNEYYSLYSSFAPEELVKEYRERSFLIGREVDVVKGDRLVPAKVITIDDECRLVVDYGDSVEALRSGEVSIKVL